MEHVAIDLGGRESQICVRSSDGTILEEKRWATRRLGTYLSKRSPSRVILETCAEAFAVADEATAPGHQVYVVPATVAPALGVGARGQKTDCRDARALSAASCQLRDLPRVHVPSTVARESKTRCGMREALVGARTRLINTVRGWLRGQLERVRSGGTSTFAQRVRSHFAESGRTVPAHVALQLETIEHLSAQIAKTDEVLKTMAQQDPRCQRLMSVPGVGAVTAVRFVAAIDEVGRFATAHQLESYLGLVPGEDSSSDRVRRTSITKAGPARVRRVLVQACWVLRRVRPEDPLVLWSKQIEGRRNRQVAVVAMARKLAGILFALWRDGTRYEPQRTSTVGVQLREQARKAKEEHVEAGLALIGSPSTSRS